MTPGLILACGCEVPFVEKETPSCATHGAGRVVRTVQMPKPRIRGVASGPIVQTMDLTPFTGRLVGEET